MTGQPTRHLLLRSRRRDAPPKPRVGVLEGEVRLLLTSLDRGAVSVITSHETTDGSSVRGGHSETRVASSRSAMSDRSTSCGSTPASRGVLCERDTKGSWVGSEYCRPARTPSARQSRPVIPSRNVSARRPTTCPDRAQSRPFCSIRTE